MRLPFLAAVLLIAGTSAARATVTIELDAGVLRNATGTATVPQGGLLQLIGSRAGANGTFAAPTATSFTGGDNLIVASFGFNQGGAGFVAGETDSTVVFSLESTASTPSPTLFDAGDAVLLRWWPSLTTASTTPGLGTTYGQYRSATGADGGLVWVSPADGLSFSVPNGLNFLTAAAGGPELDITGFATNVVTAVPEPSSDAMLAFATTVFVGILFRRQKRV